MLSREFVDGRLIERDDGVRHATFRDLAAYSTHVKDRKSDAFHRDLPSLNDVLRHEQPSDGGGGRFRLASGSTYLT